MSIKNCITMLMAAACALWASGCSHAILSTPQQKFNISEFNFPDNWATNGDAYVLTIYTTQESLTKNSNRTNRIKKSLKSVIRQYGSVIENEMLFGNQFALHAIDPGQVSIQGIQSLGKQSRIITRLNHNEVCPRGKILMMWFYADTMAQSNGYLSCKKKILSFEDAAQLAGALKSGTAIDIPINPISFFQPHRSTELTASISQQTLEKQLPALPTLSNDAETKQEVIQEAVIETSDSITQETHSYQQPLVPFNPNYQHNPWLVYHPLSFLLTPQHPVLSATLQEKTAIPSVIREDKETDLDTIIKKIQELKQRIAEEKALN